MFAKLSKLHMTYSS